jgi:hypothetical protein
MSWCQVSWLQDCDLTMAAIFDHMPPRPPPIEVESNVPQVSSRFFPQDAINAELWDQYTPYQLLIVRVIMSDQGPTYEPTRWRYTLPISPQELSLVMPIATNMQATITGTSIQHGGAPFRELSLQGTTGITPHKNRGEALRQRDTLSAIFAGTVSAAALGQNAVKRAQGNLDLNFNINKGLTASDGDPDRIPEKTTGYYQMRLMEKFIESYIALKTGNKPDEETQRLDPELSNVDPKTLRLAFCMWKDESIYLVEPLSFVKRRSAASPMEYTFQIQLRAYKRVRLNISAPDLGHSSFVKRDPSALAQLFNRFRAAREVLTDLKDILESTISDPANLLNESIRESGLFLSEMSGLRSSIENYPEDIKREAEKATATAWQTLRSQFQVTRELDRSLSAGQTLDSKQRQEFEKKIGSKVTADNLRLSNNARKKIFAENDRVKKMTRSDFEVAKRLIVKTSADFAQKIGASHPTYDALYGRSSAPTNRKPTETEMDVLFALNEMAIIFGHLAVSSQIDPPTPSSLEYVAGLAEKSGIAFRVPKSKMAVPFPYGSSLERLALQYLGDANRWHEIATLNGLRSPYVDEEGFSMDLLVNANDDYVVVGSVDRLYQGQTVWLSGSGLKRIKRHITRIEAVGANYNVITLDGERNLNQYTLNAKSKLEAFTPGTVNSQQIIYIPSGVEVVNDPETKAVPGVNTFDSLLDRGGIDLLLTPDGDLAITQDGDCRLAYGLTNIVQTVKLALTTPRGSLLQHPEYGIGLPVGINTADVDVNEILKNAKEHFSRDPMFSGVRSAFAEKKGPVLRITLEVGIAGTSQFLPISIDIR